jgi:hypothetical protein
MIWNDFLTLHFAGWLTFPEMKGSGKITPLSVVPFALHSFEERA